MIKSKRIFYSKSVGVVPFINYYSWIFSTTLTVILIIISNIIILNQPMSKKKEKTIKNNFK